MTDVEHYQAIHKYHMTRVHKYRALLQEAESEAMESGMQLSLAKEKAGLSPKAPGILNMMWWLFSFGWLRG